MGLSINSFYEFLLTVMMIPTGRFMVPLPRKLSEEIS